MSNLYKSLFKYRQREDRSPLEDFLTEALADLLNRLPEPISQRAALFLISDKTETAPDISQFWPAGANAKWRTQCRIHGGKIIDLILEIDQKPIIAVENKISARFQEHDSDRSFERGITTQNQLATYGEWVARMSNPDWGGALVLLTHKTTEPDDFLENKEVYQSRSRSVIRWTDLSCWLRKEIIGFKQTKDDWVRLSVDFLAFLKEHNMDSELATSLDLAALQIYVASADRLRNSLEYIWKQTAPIRDPMCKQTRGHIEISTEYGCIWMSKYLSRPDINEGYLALGIRFPNSTDQYNINIAPDGSPYVFVELGSEGVNCPAINNLRMPGCWKVGDNVRVAALSTRTISADPNLFVSQAATWATERVSEVAEALA